MELNSIFNYPGLHNDTRIKQIKISIEHLQKSLNEQQQEFKERVSHLQDNCPHTLRKIMEFDPNYIYGIYFRDQGDEIMKGKECCNCGFFIPRPEGSFSKICHKCGGEMEYQGKTPGQGGDGKHIDKCKDCGHTTSHT